MKSKEIVVYHPNEIPKDLPIGTKIRITAPKFGLDWRDMKWLD
jgi:hypothetical protein